MQRHPSLKSLCAVLCIVVVVAELTTAAPSYADYEMNIRDLYELLMQKEALEERLGLHHVERRKNGSPSLRLRFGRSDPSIMPVRASPYMLGQEGTERGEN